MDDGEPLTLALNFCHKLGRNPGSGLDHKEGNFRGAEADWRSVGEWREATFSGWGICSTIEDGVEVLGSDEGLSFTPEPCKLEVDVPGDGGRASVSISGV